MSRKNMKDEKEQKSMQNVIISINFIPSLDIEYKSLSALLIIQLRSGLYLFEKRNAKGRQKLLLLTTIISIY